MSDSKKQWNLKPGGVKAAAELLAGLDEATRNKLLSNILERDPEMARKLENEIFVFDHLLTFEDKDLQDLLSEVTDNRLALALRSVKDEVKAKIFKNMSKRRAETIQEEMSLQGKQKLSDVEAAQREILKQAVKLRA